MHETDKHHEFDEQSKQTHKIEEYCCNFRCFCLVLIFVALKGMILGIMSIVGASAINIIGLMVLLVLVI